MIRNAIIFAFFAIASAACSSCDSDSSSPDAGVYADMDASNDGGAND